jgi:hypothetical protein
VEEFRALFPEMDVARLAGMFASESGGGLPGSRTALSANEGTPPTPEARRVRCPHCHNPIELSDDRPDEVLCPRLRRLLLDGNPFCISSGAGGTMRRRPHRNCADPHTGDGE